jgi:hypothetical protein
MAARERDSRAGFRHRGRGMWMTGIGAGCAEQQPLARTAVPIQGW